MNLHAFQHASEKEFERLYAKHIVNRVKKKKVAYKEEDCEKDTKPKMNWRKKVEGREKRRWQVYEIIKKMEMGTSKEIAKEYNKMHEKELRTQVVGALLKGLSKMGLIEFVEWERNRRDGTKTWQVVDGQR
jgi:hypothetical protein